MYINDVSRQNIVGQNRESFRYETDAE